MLPECVNSAAGCVDRDSFAYFLGIEIQHEIPSQKLRREPQPDFDHFPRRRALNHGAFRHRTTIKDFEGERRQAVVYLLERGPIRGPALVEAPLVGERCGVWL